MGEMGDPGAARSGPAVPADVLGVELGARSLGLRVEAASYPLQAIYGAAYVFLDRCWVLLDRPEAAHVRVTLTRRDGGVGAALESLVPEFAEELVSAAWRASIAGETRALIEAATSRAHAGGAPPSLDELSAFDFGEGVEASGAMDDPLGIALSWEEKYKKKDA